MLDDKSNQIKSKVLFKVGKVYNIQHKLIDLFLITKTSIEKSTVQHSLVTSIVNIPQ